MDSVIIVKLRKGMIGLGKKSFISVDYRYSSIISVCVLMCFDSGCEGSLEWNAVNGSYMNSYYLLNMQYVIDLTMSLYQVKLTAYTGLTAGGRYF